MASPLCRDCHSITGQKGRAGDEGAILSLMGTSVFGVRMWTLEDSFIPEIFLGGGLALHFDDQAHPTVEPGQHRYKPTPTLRPPL